MRNTGRKLFSAIAMFAIIIAACGDDGGPTGTTSGDELTVAEAQEVASALFGLLFSVGLSGGSPSVAAPFQDVPDVRFSVAFDPIPARTQNCSGGGTIRVSGDYQQQGSTGISYNITQQINDCVVSGSSTTFTVNGDPNVTMTGSFSATQTAVSLDLGIRGGLRFTTDDSRSGTCAISVDITGDIDLTDIGNPATAANAVTVSGNVCGQSVNSI